MPPLLVYAGAAMMHPHGRQWHWQPGSTGSGNGQQGTTAGRRAAAGAGRGRQQPAPRTGNQRPQSPQLSRLTHNSAGVDGVALLVAAPRQAACAIAGRAGHAASAAAPAAGRCALQVHQRPHKGAIQGLQRPWWRRLAAGGEAPQSSTVPRRGRRERQARRRRHQGGSTIWPPILTQGPLLSVLSTQGEAVLSSGGGRRGALDPAVAGGPSPAALCTTCAGGSCWWANGSKAPGPACMQLPTGRMGLWMGWARGRAAVTRRSGRHPGACSTTHSPRASRQGSPQPAAASGGRSGPPQVTIAICAGPRIVSERGEPRRAR